MSHLFLGIVFLIAGIISGHAVSAEPSDLDSYPLEMYFRSKCKGHIFRQAELDQISPDEVFGIDFDGSSLQAIPVGLRRFKNLVFLSFTGNRIELNRHDIDLLAQCSGLKYLGLSANKITKIPSDIAKLSANTNLLALNLSNNKAIQITDQIYSISSLYELGLVNCNLAKLPDGISRLTNLCVLYLDFNPLETLPPDFSDLHLRKISAIRCKFSENVIDLLPASLESVVFGKNSFTEIPPSIVKLKHLQDIGLNDNEISVISGEIAKLSKLEWLGLVHNKIKTLPAAMASMQQLKLVDLQENPITIGVEWDAWIKSKRLMIDEDRMPK